jgi:hypothetical protein
MENNSIQDEILRKMSPERKLEAAVALYRSSRQLKTAWIASLHKDWSQEKIAKAVRESFANARS